MLLYHGTVESVGRIALSRGLLTRSNHRGKWNWRFAGHRHVVYLTNAYPVVYAHAAYQRSKHPQRLAIVEIDSDRLDSDNMVPDEDMLALTLGRQQWPDLDATAAAIRYRAHLRDYADQWQTSLRMLGTCGYFGNIPVEAVTRVALVDFHVAFEPVLMALDAIVSLQSYRLVGAGHRAITRWFFGDPPPEDMNDLQRFLVQNWIDRLARIERKGIEVVPNSLMQSADDRS